MVAEVGYGEIQHGSLLVRVIHPIENRGIQRRGREKSPGEMFKKSDTLVGVSSLSRE